MALTAAGQHELTLLSRSSTGAINEAPSPAQASPRSSGNIPEQPLTLRMLCSGSLLQAQAVHASTPETLQASARKARLQLPYCQYMAHCACTVCRA